MPVMVGAGGLVAATNDADAVDAAPLPKPLVANTVQVYVLLFVSVVTVSGDVAPVRLRVVPPLLEVHVAVKLVIALPPLPFAVNATITVLFPRVTPVSVGASGTSPATKDDDATEAALSPNPLVATTAHVYVLLFVSELTVIGDDAPDTDRVAPPSLDVHVAANAVIGSPALPLAVNATTAELLPRVTPVTLGAGGFVAATKDDDADDEGLSPTALVATAVHV